MRRHLGDIGVVLQITPGYIQRQLGAIQHALEHKQIFRDDFLDVVRHEHLIVIQLDLPLNGLILIVQPREVQDSFEVERIVRIDVNPEQRVAVVVEHLAIESLVVIRCTLGWRLLPERVGIIDRLLRRLRVCRSVLAALAVFGFFLLVRLCVLVREVYLSRHEGAVFLQHIPELLRVQELFLVRSNVQNHIGAVRFTLCREQFVATVRMAKPTHGRCPAPRLGDNLNVIRHHKS